MKFSKKTSYILFNIYKEILANFAENLVKIIRKESDLENEYFEQFLCTKICDRSDGGVFKWLGELHQQLFSDQNQL